MRKAITLNARLQASVDEGTSNLDALNIFVAWATEALTGKPLQGQTGDTGFCFEKLEGVEIVDISYTNPAA